MPPTDTANATQTSGLLDQLDAIRLRTEALLARVPDDAAFNRQPGDGGWSVGQCLDHLNQMNRLYFGAIRGALSRAQRRRAPVTAPLVSSWFGNWFAASMEPGTRKMGAPRKAVPRSSVTRATAVKRMPVMRDIVARMRCTTGSRAIAAMSRATAASSAASGGFLLGSASPMPETIARRLPADSVAGRI